MAREIQDNIKLFIKDQLPGFYQAEGPMFATFLDAYYEYLEQNGQTLDYSRDLIPRVLDVDSTTAEFLEHFKKTYLEGFPGSFQAGTDITIKNVLDFYKSKGSPRAIELLFQILYADKASVAYPADDVLRPSNAKYEKPKYIEVYAPSLSKLVGMDKQEIIGATTGARAFVETIVTKLINQVKVHVVYLSNVRGEFKRGEVVALSSDGIQDDMPKVIGSLSSIDIVLGGKDFAVGDTFTVTSDSGTGGLVRTSNVSNATGLVEFKLANGGFGFSTNTSFTTIDINEAHILTTNKINAAQSYSNSSQIDNAEFLRWEYVDQTSEKIDYLSGSTLSAKITELLQANDQATPIITGRTSSAQGNTQIAQGYLIANTLNNANGTITVAPTQGSFGDQRQLTIAYQGLGNTQPFILNEPIHEENLVDLTYHQKAGTFNAGDVVKGSVSGANGIVVSDSGTVLQVNGSFGTWDEDDNVQKVSDVAITANVLSISIANTGANGVVAGITSNTVIKVADITGLFNNGKKVHGTRSHAIAGMTADPVNSGVADIYYNNGSATWANTQAVVDGYSNTSVEGQVIGSNTNAVGLRYVKFANSATGKFQANLAAPIIGRESNTYANVTGIGTGSGAGYEIGQLENTEDITIYTDFVGGNNVANVSYLDCVIDGGNSGVGFLNNIDVTNGGSGYTNNQIVHFDLGGAGGGRPTINAEAKLVVTSGEVVGMTVTNPGKGYFSNSTGNTSNLSGGSGLAFTPHFDFGYGFPKDENGDFTTILDNVLTRFSGTIGTIASLAKINPGNNYNFDPFTAVYTQGIAGYDRKDLVVNIENKNGTFIQGENVNQTVTLQGQRLTFSGNSNVFLTGESVKQLLATNSTSSTFAIGDIYDHGATQMDVENPRIKVEFSNGFFTVDVSNAIPFTASSNTILGTVSNQTATLSAVTTQQQTQTAKGQVYAQTEDELRLRRLSFSVSFNDTAGTKLVGATSGAQADIGSVYEDDTTRAIGDNSVITANTLAANGIVSEVEILASGYGYNHDAELTLVPANTENQIVVTGTANVHFTGQGEGTWRDQESFLNTKYIHDNDFYQTHSYVIESGLSLDKYRDILLKVAHVGGTRLFGKVISENIGNTTLTTSSSTTTIGATAANGLFTES